MGTPAPLTPKSARVMAAVKLHRHSGRMRSGLFLAEGPNLVEAAAAHGVVDEVFATAAAVDRYGALVRDLPVHLVTEPAAKVLSDTVTPSGLIAVCRIPDPQIGAVLAEKPTLIAVAVDLSEPGIAGTLIRIGHAMGADAVVFAGHSVDPYNGKCLRSSAGSIFSVPVIVETDTAGVLAQLRSAGLRIVATTLNGDMSLDDVGAVLATPTAWVFGPESQGLSEEVAGLADDRVVIPMSVGAESLNVAAAAAICLYQSARAQRQSLG
jgi:TrmH family RNA methyltransferase